MVGASIETTLELWACSLRDVKSRIRPLFHQTRVAASAGQFLDGLLGNEPRKTGWMRAEAAGDPGPWRQQAILGRGHWDADVLRDIVRDYALETLADEDPVLVIDETGFLKQGKASCGVARQYTGSAGNHVFNSWGKKQFVRGTAAKIAQTLPGSAWRRLSAGDGTKGARLHDWACVELANLDAGEYNSALTGEWTRGLLIRRNITDGDLAFFSTWCPRGTPMQKLVSIEGHRWAIEDSFETAKNELGLDHNESRSWHGWHRHVSLVMLAFAMMAVIRHHANAPPLKKTVLRLRTTWHS
jgi:SRSO17 transposase